MLTVDECLRRRSPVGRRHVDPLTEAAPPTHGRGEGLLLPVVVVHDLLAGRRCVLY